MCGMIRNSKGEARRRQWGSTRTHPRRKRSFRNAILLYINAFVLYTERNEKEGGNRCRKKQEKSWNGFETVKPSLEGKVVMSIAVRAHNILMHSRIKQSSDPYKSLSSGTTTNFESHLAFVFAFMFLNALGPEIFWK